MRVALFTETFLPKIDGIVNTLCKLLNHLQMHGHEAILFAPAGGPVEYAGTPVITYEGISVPFYPELKLVPPFSPGIEDHLRKFQPDLVHVLNPVTLGLAGIQTAKTMNLPVLASYHTDIPGYTEPYGFGFSKDLVWRFFRWIHNQADLNLCPSRATQAELVAQGFKRVRVWGRGVDTRQFSPTHRSQTWRARLSGGQTTSPTFLYVGRLAAEKRVDLLLPVIKALPAAHLAIVGDGPMRAELETMFSGTNTHFLGYLSGAELAAAYASADYFVFTGANETFGNVILEAMASGLPVIAPASGGVLDSVIPGITGLLYPPEDGAALLAATQNLLANRPLARKMAKIARMEAEQRTWENNLNGLLAHYQTLLNLPQEAQIPIRLPEIPIELNSLNRF